MIAKKWRAGNKRDLIIEVWEALDCESVGRRELDQIQKELKQRFGNGAAQSPAAIARIVADEGAVLRHPEVFDYDLCWREQQAGKSPVGELAFFNIAEALESFKRLEEGRQEAQKDAEGLNSLRELVVVARQNLLLTARSKIIASYQREEAKEIASWLAVWLQSPQLFPDWLELRRRSPQFLKKFPELKNL